MSGPLPARRHHSSTAGRRRPSSTAVGPSLSRGQVVNHRQRSSKDEPPQHVVTPLYDARYEHDACGVGFVADAGGRSRERVLPLALAGLAALGHRGAFGADGESSDGAGIALPLDRSVLEHLLFACLVED